MEAFEQFGDFVSEKATDRWPENSWELGVEEMTSALLKVLRPLESYGFQPWEERMPIVIAPFGRSGRGLDGREDFVDAPLPGVLVLEFAVELAIGRDQGGGAVHDEGDLVVRVALVNEKDDTCKCRDVVFNRTERVVQPPRDLIGLVTQQKETHRLHPVGLARADILLLSAARNLELAAQVLDIADDGTNAAVEETKGKILVAEQPSLVVCLGGQAEDSGTSPPRPRGPSEPSDPLGRRRG